MLPIPKACLHILIRDELNDAVQAERISKELAFCRKNRDKILRQARRTYDRIISNVSESLSHNSCDFLLLEKAYHEYLLRAGKNIVRNNIRPDDTAYHRAIFILSP